MILSDKHRIIVSVTGASGSVYAKVLLDKLVHLKDQIDTVGLLISDNAMDVWKHELGNEDYLSYPFARYAKNDFTAPFASGSARYGTMIVCPCSMGTLGRIASVGIGSRSQAGVIGGPAGFRLPIERLFERQCDVRCFRLPWYPG